MLTCHLRAGIFAGVFLLAGISADAQNSFTLIPQLPGGTGGNTASGVSGDGRFIVGTSDSTLSQGTNIEDGYRFDRITSTLLSIGTIVPGNYGSQASAISRDGTVVVGFGRINASGVLMRALTWHETPVSIASLGVPSGTGASFSYGVSNDNLTIVGSTSAVGFVSGQAFRWTQAGGFVLLPALPGSGASSARAVNGDGSVIVGDSAGLPFRWTSTGGAGTTTPLPAIAGAPDGFGEALALAASGTVVAGSITSPTLVDNSLGFAIPQPVAFKWTTGGGTAALGALPSTGSQTSEAFGVSRGGLVVVGQSRTSGDISGGVSEAFVWTPRWGMLPLTDKLPGLVPAGVRLDLASGVTNNPSAPTQIERATSIISGSGTNLSTSRPVAFAATVVYCIGDHNDNGVTDVPDIFAYLHDWFAYLIAADANGNGVIEVADIFAFLTAWFAGC